MRTEVQVSLLEILVVQQRVASAEINELARPSPDRRRNLAQPELSCRIRRGPHFSLSRNLGHANSCHLCCVEARVPALQVQRNSRKRLKRHYGIAIRTLVRYCAATRSATHVTRRR